MKRNIMYKGIALLLVFVFCISDSNAQGFNIPTKTAGISFGNSPNFNGLRFNFIDRNIKEINGINVTIWNPNDESATGTINGLSIGLPMAYGSEYRNGVSWALFGVGAKRDVKGISVGGLAVGSGNDLVGFQFGGLAVGSGFNLTGISMGGMAVGSGNNIQGISLGGLAVGSGNDIQGISIGGLAVGAGNNIVGLNIGGIAVGAGNDITGLNVGGLAVGGGGQVTGINISGLAIGSGEKVEGVNLAGLAIGAPKVRGLNIAPIVGGQVTSGLTVAPIYHLVKSENEKMGIMKGVAISSFNNIKGNQRGLTIGILNIAHHLDGFQIGLINIAKSNRRGLKVLPLFNGPFH